MLRILLATPKPTADTHRESGNIPCTLDHDEDDELTLQQLIILEERRPFSRHP